MYYPESTTNMRISYELTTSTKKHADQKKSVQENKPKLTEEQTYLSFDKIVTRLTLSSFFSEGREEKNWN